MNTNIIEKLKHDKTNQEFVLPLENGKAFISYSIRDGIMYLRHSEVPLNLRGQGIGKELTEQTFEYIQSNNIEAIAVCPYIRLIRERNSKWHDVIG